MVVDLDREGSLLARLNPIALLHGKHSLDTTLEAKALIDRAAFMDITTGKIPVRNLGFVLGWKAAQG